MFSSREIQDLLISWITLSVAFAWDIHFQSFLEHLPLYLLVVGTAFILHELGHKFSAIRLGYYAEYRAWMWGLVLAVLLAATSPFVFAAPGAVYILGQPNRRDNGIISLAGPLVNFTIAAVSFTLLLLGLPAAVANVVYAVGYVNTFLGMFNMIPIYPLDGSKVIVWDKGVYFATVLAFLGLYALYAFV
ncbi:MAG: site-2 protease family protein [Candidatus Diapherotrites archaeon]|nr:site-2 protease family protein [Candidatus Diapherotrites archaeon]